MDVKNIVLLGFDSTSKSNLVGNIIYQTRNIDKDMFEKIKKDFPKEERWSILVENYKRKTEKVSDDSKYSIIPIKIEEREFIFYNMTDDAKHIQSTINCIYDNDIKIACLVIDAEKFDTTEFDIVKVIEHIILARACGIEHFIVCISQMDQVKWNQDIYNTVVDEIGIEVEHLNFKTLKFIPISGYTGLGVKKQNTPATWYTENSVLETFVPIKITGNFGGPVNIKSTSKYMCYVSNSDEDAITSGYECILYIDKTPYNISFTNIRNKNHQKYSKTGDNFFAYVKYIHCNSPPKINKNRIVITDKNNITVGYGRIQ